MTRGRKPLPEGERMVVLAVRVPQKIVDWLDYIATASGLSRSQAARNALIYGVPDPHKVVVGK
ncbi:MAG: hypothetical protein BWX54_01972 [Verrucomicrobia bacterium ADurb.Bin018]|nr:MAG: hypothetical protein BWX54_01972 [Verrucomicrobia bacterium ADurb.Bin018]